MTERGDIETSLADLLARIPAMTRSAERDVIRQILKDKGYELPETPDGNPRVICYHIIKAAAGQPGILQQLAESIRWVDGSYFAENFVREIRRQLPGDFFALNDRLGFIAAIRDFTRPDQLHMYYKRIVGDTCPVELADASDLVSELEELSLEEPCHPLIMLTEEIAARVRRHRRAARAWSDRLADLIDGIRQDEASAQRAKLALLRKSQRTRHYADPAVEHASLVVLLDPNVPNPSDGYKLRVWLYCAEPSPVQSYTRDDPVSLETVREVVVEQLEKVIGQLSAPGAVADVVIEFFLPRELLDLAVEDWVVSSGNVTLGTQFVVVIRDRDRLYSTVLWPPWQQKWQQVASRKTGPNGPFSRWITCMDAPCRPGELRPSLLDNDFVSVGLTFPPPPSARRLELAEALNAGIPVVVWPHRQCTHPVPASAADVCHGNSFMNSVSQELAGRRLSELPNLIRQLRRAHAAAGDLGIALLWDDPNRRPIPDVSHFDVPHYRP